MVMLIKYFIIIYSLLYQHEWKLGTPNFEFSQLAISTSVDMNCISIWKNVLYLFYLFYNIAQRNIKKKIGLYQHCS